jgi:hypothetical protein
MARGEGRRKGSRAYGSNHTSFSGPKAHGAVRQTSGEHGPFPWRGLVQRAFVPPMHGRSGRRGRHKRLRGHQPDGTPVRTTMDDGGYERAVHGFHDVPQGTVSMQLAGGRRHHPNSDCAFP